MVWIGPGSLRERVVWGLQEKSDGKAKSGLERVRQDAPAQDGGVVAPAGSDRSAGEGRSSHKTRSLVSNGDVAAPGARTGDGVIFDDGRGTVEAVEVHRSWPLKAPAVSVAMNRALSAV